MFTKPIDNSIQDYFDNLYLKAKNTALAAYESFKQELNGLDHFNQVKRLVEENDRADEVIDKDPHPYCARNSMHPDSLLMQFANRTFLLSVDESDELVHAVVAGEYCRLLSEHLRGMEESVPKYSYQMFINGVHCPYFLALPSDYTTDRNTHNTIREWQAHHMQCIITYDYLNIVADIQHTC
jgi:hypothetical protein